jgi:FdhD protein
MEMAGRDELSTESVSGDSAGESMAPVSAWVCDKGGSGTQRSLWVVKEQPVTLYLNGQELVTLLCLGQHLDELAVGFLHGEGFLERLGDMERLEVDVEKGRVDVTTRAHPYLADRLWSKRTITSGCGKGSVFYSALDALLAKPVEGTIRLSPLQVWERVEELNRLSQTYRRTHGVHNTALAEPDGIILFRDDIGRHNAVDMIIGYAFLHGISLQDKILITTGRLTSEILIKTAKVGIPVLISRNTATILAIELAGTLNVTLIGYARAGKCTVYTRQERIICDRKAPEAPDA